METITKVWTVDVDTSPTNPDQLLKIGEDQFDKQGFFAKVLLLGSAGWLKQIAMDGRLS